MKEENKLEKMFNLTRFGVKIIAVFLLVVYFGIYAHPKKNDRNEILLWLIAPLVFSIIFLLYNFLLVYFHKKGFYTSEQAAEFYEKCSEENISVVNGESVAKARDIYFSIFGTDKYLCDGTILSHIEEIYNCGKEITEKNRE